WDARGSGTRNTVTPEGWKLFRERLAEARKFVEAAWKTAPTNAAIPNAMLQVAVGQQWARSEMEQWFKRAMDLDPKNYRACDIKLGYLQPKWYGSAEDMVAFGRECLTNNW